MQEVITSKEAAVELGVTTTTVRRAAHRGELRAVYGGLRKNRVVGIYRDSVDALRKVQAQSGGRT